MARTMSSVTCPVCSMEDVLSHADRFECSTCGHEWRREAVAEDDLVEGARVVKDANGTVLADGDSVTLIKDLKLRGSSDVRSRARR